MAGWDGNGNFILPYSMVAQAAAKVDILSTVQDTQWNSVATGLMNCMTLDGQTKPKANIGMNGFKLTNLLDPTSAQDAATKNYVDTSLPVASEWILDTHTPTWVSATSFKFSSVNLTGTYTVGRRLKIVHNTGATTSYGTIVSSVYGVDTTIVVAMDGGVALVSTTTAVSYGLTSYINPSYLDPRTAVLVMPDVAAAVVGTSTVIPFNHAEVDALSEFNTSTYTFTPRYPGKYRFALNYTLQVIGAGPWTGNITGSFVRNTLIESGAQQYFTNQSGTFYPSVCAEVIYNLAVTDTVQAVYYTTVAGNLYGNVTNANGHWSDTALSISRVP